MRVIKTTERPGKFLWFLYRNPVGRCVLRLLTHPVLSKAIGAFLDSKCSTIFIKPYIRRYQIDLSAYAGKNYASFNAFFTRKVRPECRPFDQKDEALVSPCDGKLSVYPISGTTVFPVKGRSYTVGQLLRDEELAAQFYGGYCFVFRLTVDDYHRYCYFDSGQKGRNIVLKGRLHTVRPVALEQEQVFCENSREYTVLESDHFGRAVQMEVGALMVGRICNYHQARAVRRGEEKGRFEFGGSTVILMLQRDRVHPEQVLLDNTANGWETEVRCGERIGSGRSTPSEKKREWDKAAAN